jgi:multicomponent K+:H+ antiporter subunit A
LSVAYSVRFIHDVFFNGEPINLPRVPHEPPRWMRIPVEALVLVCLAVGIAPGITIAPVLAAAARGTLGVGELPAYSLSLWHGFNLPLLMSAVALAAGVVFYFGLQRTLDLHSFTLVRSFGRRLFTAVLAVLEAGGRALVAHSPSGSLPRSLAWIVGGAVLAMAWPLYVLGIGAPPRALLLGDPDKGMVVICLVAWVMAVGGALGVTLLYRHRFLAVVLVGGVGLAVSLTFLLLSAPDLALTQLLVEIATVALIMAVLHRLPATSPKEPGTVRKLRDAALALVAGAGLMWIMHAVLTRPFDPISPYFLERSLTEGGGTNVVNVILVDFRGFDTLGEITVLGIAGLLVFALLHALRSEGLRVLPVTDWNPLLVRTVVRTLLPLATMVAIYLFLRGHNEPGGGFIAGLTFACALVALRIGGGGRPLDGTAAPPFAPWIGVGLLVAGGTGLGSLLVGHPFLTSTFTHPVLPGLGEIPLASAALFDLGVFVTVVAATLLATFTPGLLPAVAELHPGSRAREQAR